MTRIFTALITVLTAGLISVSTFAADQPTLVNLNLSQADGVMKNFGNAIVFRSLEPPSANGKVWGFGIGVAAAGTSAKDVNALIPNAHIPLLPAADIVFALQGPYGIAIESGFFPSVAVKGFSLKRFGMNARWTFTDVILRGNIPFDAALRVGFGNNKFSYNQVSSGINDTVSFTSNALRLELAMSRKFLVFEPYIGLGLLRTSNTLSHSAGVSSPLFSFTSADSYSNSQSSFLFNIGTEIKLLFFTFTPELDIAFGETTGAAKFGMKF